MPPTQAPPLPFEQALTELETILRELEDGTTSLEDALMPDTSAASDSSDSAIPNSAMLNRK